MDQKEPRCLKTVLIGAAETGKTCLMQNLTQGKKPSQIKYKTTIGVDFQHVERTNTKLQFWDTAGQERFSSVSNLYFKDAALILIVVNPESIQNGTHDLDKQIERAAKQAPPEATILYVITQWDKADEASVTKDDCERVITQATGYKEEKGNILYYSSETATDTERSEFLNTLLSAIPEDKELVDLDKPQNPSDPAVKQEGPTPYFTGLRVFGFLVLFAVLGTTFLALGGVTGGAQQIWFNIGEFFSAIQSAVDVGAGVLAAADWGIGVLVASILLAAAITGGSMLIDYYRKAGDEPDSNAPDKGQGYEEREKRVQTTNLQRNPGQGNSPLVGSKEKEENNDSSSHDDDENPNPCSTQ